MKIELSNFGGIVPSQDPANLPENAAQEANNVDLSGGTLRPWGITNAFTRLHDAAGEMNPGFDVGDIAKITKANTPTRSSEYHMCYPDWITIRSYIFVEYIDPDTEEFVSSSNTDSTSSPGWQWTNDGFILRSGSLVGNDFTFKPDVAYTIKGPFYKFYLYTRATTRYKGAPDTEYVLPASVSSGSEEIPSFSVPLVYPTTMDGFSGYSTSTSSGLATYQYGTLQCIDVNGPQISGPYVLPEGTVDDVNRDLVEGSTGVSFTFTCNYIRPRKTAFYVQQYVDTDGRDGPESEVSEEIEIPAGSVRRISTSLATGYTHNRLFRSTNAESGFVKLADVDGDIYYDNYHQALITELPPNGNVPHATVADAIKGAVKHPAGYAVYYYGSDLRPSSEWIELERPWAVPEEYTNTFDSEIECIAMAVGTILVFTQNKVYSATGQHPGRLSYYEISDKPILDKVTLWTTHDMIGWVNEEGLAIYAGNSANLLTGDYYRAEQWSALTPADFEARVNDRTVCLFNDDDTGLRFDLRGPREAAISEFTATDGNSEYYWKSRTFYYQKIVSWRACRVLADDYPIGISLLGDGIERSTSLVLDARPMLLPLTARFHEWEVGITGTTEVRQVVIGSSMAEV